MRRLFGVFGILGFVVILGSPGFAQTPPDEATGSLSHGATVAKSEPPTIQIRLRDYARAPKGMLARAVRETTQIFQNTGIEIEWIRCKLSAEGLPENQECKEGMSPTILLLSILPRSMAARLSPHYEKFGYALPVGNGDFGFVAGVFYHRVDELVEWRGQDKASRATVLGHMMAHEIGHLLLGPDSHSATGIMLASLRPKDLERAAQGALQFTPQQAKQMRAQVRARMIAGRARGVD